ncbi:MAG: carboxypeptidase-like regulatory domain-containing protein, partial [Candidatus Hydrogenedentales bacterium]
MNLSRLCVALTLALLKFGSSAFAQQELGPLSVIVKDESGKPVPGATVQCVNWDNSFARTEPLTAREQGTSDANGRAQFEGVTIGQAFVRVISGDKGGWFRVQDGSVDVPLTIGVGHSAEVTVQDESGKPIEGVIASADGSIPFGTTDEDGKVKIRNHGVSYEPELYFAKKGYGWEAAGLHFNPERIIVTLKPGITLEGTVTGPDGKPVPEAEVWWNRNRKVNANAEGVFTFPEVAVGSTVDLHVLAWKQKPALVGDASIVLTDPPIQKVAITLKSTGRPKEDSPGATVSGVVVHAETGKPVQATLLLEHSSAFEWPDRVANTDAEGRFTIKNIQGDRVWLYAAPSNPALYAVDGLIQIDTRDTKAITIKVGEGCAIRGQVVNDDDTPVAGAEVMFRPMSPYHRPARTQRDGRFLIPYLDGAGITYTVSVSDEMRREANLEIGPMEKGEIRSGVELRLPKPVMPATLTGTVVDTEGKALANVNFYLNFERGGPEPSILTATSDDAGHFAIPIPRSGTVTISAHKVTQVAQERGGSDNISTDCAVLEGKTAVLVEGTDSEIRLVVSPKQVRLLALKVMDNEGNPIKAEVTLLRGKHNRDGVYLQEDGRHFVRNLPEEPYAIEVMAPQYRACVLFPGVEFREGDMNVTVKLTKGPFPVGESVWETVTGRPATAESLASTPLADMIRERERTYFMAALPPRERKPVPATPDGRSPTGLTVPYGPTPTAIQTMRIVDAGGKPVTRILIERLTLPDFGKAVLLPSKSGAQLPQSSEDGVYPMPTNDPNTPIVVSAPGLARVLVRTWGLTANETIALYPPATVELNVRGVDGRPTHIE